MVGDLQTYLVDAGIRDAVSKQLEPTSGMGVLSSTVAYTNLF
jgi:hypothetical protein